MSTGQNSDTAIQSPAPPQHFANNSSLARRAVGAIVVFVPTLAAALAGGWWFTALIFAIALLATLEIHQLLRFAGIDASRVIAVMTFVAAFAAVRLPVSPVLIMPGATVLVMTLLTWQMFRGGALPITQWATSMAGGLYAGLTSAYLALLRELPGGFWWVFLAVGATWVADSGAYFIGKRWGRRKLAPVISPKKTWEGYLGGIVCGVLFGIVVGTMTPLGIPRSIIAALLASSLGTIGDLAESLFKRQANAKDSGNLIPGMGGAFDRIDSLLWAGVIAWLVATVSGP